MKYYVATDDGVILAMFRTFDMAVTFHSSFGFAKLDIWQMNETGDKLMK
jgi:hypothetical protein